ncbi:MAG: hypothetical protein ACRETM_07515 [Stenotrophobium sp.]
MNVRLPPSSARIALLIFFVLLAFKYVLEVSMTTQMLVQIPSLVVVGLLLSRAVPERVNATLASCDYHGITGLVLATLVAALWMLPRLLDASITEPSIAVAKYLSIPLLIGLPFALSWPRMSFIVRGVFLLELIATFFRMGWLYSIWPDRLCNNYLLGDQQRLGKYMVLIGVLLLLWTACKLLWGRMDAFAEAPPAPLSRATDADINRRSHHADS